MTEIPKIGENYTGAQNDAFRSKGRLQPADVNLLRQGLLAGDDPLARRADLIALHRKITEMHATLGEGLRMEQREQSQVDRRALQERIGALETAVNRIEGALGIELIPRLDKMIEVAVEARISPRRGRRSGAATGIAAMLVVALLALAVGVGFSNEIRSFVLKTEGEAGPVAAAPGHVSDTLSPNGGIGDSAKGME